MVTADSVQIIQNQIIRAADNNVAVEVKSVDNGNRVKPVAPNLVLQFEQAGNAAVIGNGYRPASTVIVWLLSTPTRLGEVTVKADGSFDASMLIPADFPVGNHTLQVNGVTANNEIVSTSIGVVVIAKPAPIPTEPVVPTITKRQVLNLSFFPTQTGPERSQAVKIRNLIPRLNAGDVVTCKAFTTTRSTSQLRQARAIAKRLCAPVAANSALTLKFNSNAPSNANQLAWAKRKPIRVQVFVKSVNN